MNKELHRIALTAIIHKNEDDKIKYLITKRSEDKKAFPGKWTVPGGGLETDDYINLKPTTDTGHWYNAIENALRREVLEEVNVKVGELSYLLDIAFIRPDDVPVVILSYYGPYESGEVELDEDSAEYAWVTYEEAKGYDLIDGILGEIEMVEKELNKKC